MGATLGEGQRSVLIRTQIRARAAIGTVSDQQLAGNFDARNAEAAKVLS